MTRDEEMRFGSALQDAIEQAKQFDYHPHRFVGLIASKGPFQTVKDIVASGKPSEGFAKLLLAGRADLTCEAIVVETEWRPFFDEDLLQIAESRLTKSGYKWRAFKSSTNHSSPATRVTSDDAISVLLPDDFIPPANDGREKAFRESFQRTGQADFRTSLIETYGAKCMITGVDIPETLEAAHICSYRGPKSHHVRNGLLLRADIHILFDRYLLSIEPARFAVRLSSRLKGSSTYTSLEACKLILSDCSVVPSINALKVHWDVFNGSSQ